MKNMRQAVMTQPGSITIHEIAKPQVKPNQVLIQIRRIGVCGSDIHVFHGLHPYTSYPVVQGHEVSGIIAEVGSQVKGLSVGDKAVFMPQVTCGECYPCRHGMYHICDQLKVMGFQTSGAAQEFFTVDAEMVLRVPAAINLDQAAMIEPVSVAVHALQRYGEVKGQKAVVLGAGTIGNLVAQVAKAKGAQVIITDVSDYKLGKARQCGLQNVVNPSQQDLGAAIRDTFGPDKADLILECVGVQDTITQAIVNARKGSTIIVVGVFGKKPEVDLGLVQDRELSILGTLMYQKADYHQAIDLIEQAKLNLEPMVTHRFPFQEYLDAYHAIENSAGQYMKVMIEL
jgi:L-iditol 2-dehydrogenase